MDLFMTLYGTFKWDDVSAKTVARARAQRLSGRLHSLTMERQMIPSLQKTKNFYLEIATIFANGLAKNTMHWRWMCDSKEWVVDPNDASKCIHGVNSDLRYLPISKLTPR